MIRFRTAFFVGLGLFLLWFLYLEREILTPFIFAAIFSYIMNPLVSFFSDKLKLPRGLSVGLIYFLIIGIVVFASVNITRRIISESNDLSYVITNTIEVAAQQVTILPDWIRPVASDTLVSIEQSKVFSVESLLLFFPKAISGIIGFVIFVFSGFYFLKEGRRMFAVALNGVPRDYKKDVEVLMKRINNVLGSYLRGQLFLVLLVSLILFVALTILGIRFALILAIFSGFAEIVPFIGPFVAGGAAAIVALVTGSTTFPLTPLMAALLVAIVYFVVRQIQDYFITPHIMGKITELHPLVILFAVLSGGHLFGILGLILAVPVAATIRILLSFSLDKFNEQNTPVSPNKKS